VGTGGSRGSGVRQALAKGAQGTRVSTGTAQFARFAVAFKEAITAFRNTGTFDHEYFWAPYTLFGLG